MNIASDYKYPVNTIEVTEIRPVRAGNLKAFVSVKILDITIHDFRIIQQPNQRPWVSMPMTEWLEGRRKRYKPLCQLPKELKEQVSKKVLEAYLREIKSAIS